MGHGWYKLPKNTSNCKQKLVAYILSLCTQSDDKYYFSQRQLILMLKSNWGTDSGTKSIHDNDKIPLFGIILPTEHNRPSYQRLTEVVTIRSQLEDPSLSPTSIFTKLQLEFNSEDLVVKMLPEAVDVADT